MQMKRGFAVGCAAAALTAFILWAAFPPRSEAYGVAFALAPMLALTRGMSPKRAAGWWFACGFAFWFATLSWMPAICRNGGPWPLVVLGWAGLSAACAGYFALFGALNARLWARTPPLLAVFGEAVLWAGCEWMRGTLFSGFAWNFLGTALGAMPRFASPAQWGGPYLVSAMAVLVNGVFATGILRAVMRTRRRMQSLETALPLLAAWTVLQLSAVPPQDDAAQPLRVAMLQRNAPCVFSRQEREDPHEAFGRLADEVAFAKPDLLVCAESAMAEFGGNVLGARARAEAADLLKRSTASALVAGGDDVEPACDGKAARVYNAAALYTPDGGVQVYRKQHLVPFGEYIPLDKWIPPLQKLSPIGVSLHSGEPRVLQFACGDGDSGERRLVRVAPIICFEDTIPALSRQAARKGAEVIVLITNDSWFSNSNEAGQHAAQAVLRAIETGVPVVRTGNSGVSGVINPDGTAHWFLGDDGRPLVDEAGAQIDLVRPATNSAPTAYVRFGDWPLAVASLLVLVLLFRRARNNEPATPDAQNQLQAALRRA